MSATVVDTNVAIVANGKNPQATQNCVLACVVKLRELCYNGVIVIDDQDYIFNEYKKYLNFKGQPGTGDAFFRHLYQKQHDPAKVERVSVKLNDTVEQTYEEFPDDPQLAGFHRKDRKFVAVAITSINNPSVINAVDSGWRTFQNELGKNGIVVEQLCPDHWDER